MDCRVATLLAMTAFSAAAQPALADRIFVSNEKDNTVTVLDGDSLTITDTIKTGQRPRDIHVSVDGKSVYVCASDSDRIDWSSVWEASRFAMICVASAKL